MRRTKVTMPYRRTLRTADSKSIRWRRRAMSSLAVAMPSSSHCSTTHQRLANSRMCILFLSIPPPATTSSSPTSESATPSSPSSPPTSFPIESLPPPLLFRKKLVLPLFLLPSRNLRVNLPPHLRLLGIQILIPHPSGMRSKLTAHNPICPRRMLPSIRTKPRHEEPTDPLVLDMSQSTDWSERTESSRVMRTCRSSCLTSRTRDV